MSVLSRKTKSSHVSSILKTTSFGSDLNKSRSSVKVRFQLPFVNTIQEILENYLETGVTQEYQQLVVLIRDCELFDSDLESLIEEATDCIPILNRDLRLFVEAILSVEWVGRSEKTVAKYQALLVNILTAHNYYLKFAVDKLIGSFLPEPSEPEWTNGVPSDTDCVKYANVHQVLSYIFSLIPMSGEIILQIIVSKFPYLNKSAHIHEVYVHNLLWILSYQPKLKHDILRIIYTKLVLLDVNAPREEIIKAEESEDVFEMETDGSSNDSMKFSVAHTLDVCLDRMFNYFITECHNLETQEVEWEKLKGMYHDLSKIFDQIILPTYDTHHVQFSMFILCSFNSTITEGFLQYLWRKVCMPREAAVIRQSAVSYIASLLARGSFVSLALLKSTLKEMSSWVHSYIASQDGNEFVNTDLRVHSVFYYICQSIFYVIAFRQKELVSTKKNITFLESLNLPKIVTSKLNPLRVCQPAVVQNFAAVTRKYQLAYCYSVMEHNARNVLPVVYQDDKGSYVTSSSTLPGLFPFDPYLLKRSGQKIWPFYLKYQESEMNSSDEVTNKENRSVEDDDFLCDQTTKMEKFSYGTSPGFKHLQ